MKLKHGEHNESLSDYLLETKIGEFNDWIVTTSFYACIHFVEHKMFPMSMGGENFKTFLDYCNYQQERNNNLSKHTHKSRLVKNRLPKISAQYRWLRDACHGSRYTNYNVSDQKAHDSNKIMKIIKNECV